MPIASIPWEKITHINYAFATPEEDGELNVDGNINSLVSAAHAKGIND